VLCGGSTDCELFYRRIWFNLFALEVKKNLVYFLLVDVETMGTPTVSNICKFKSECGADKETKENKVTDFYRWTKYFTKSNFKEIFLIKKASFFQLFKESFHNH
jgi:hypothetical protein